MSKVKITFFALPALRSPGWTSSELPKLILCQALWVNGCATPDVIETRKLDDKKLSCYEIKQEIDEANRFEREARSERKVTGKNVAAAVFFWPALLGTYANTEEEIDAAKERKRYLHELYEKGVCS